MLVYSASSSSSVICQECLYGDSLAFRLKGLLGRESLGDEEGILLKPCNSIHMFFMKFAIDAIFLDKNNRILHIAHSIRPWRLSALIFGAVSVLEVKAGTALKHQLSLGEEITFSIRQGCA